MKRQDLRRHAFLITFARSINFDTPSEAINNYLISFKDDFEKENGRMSENNLKFIKDIINGISNNIEEIDSIISKYSKDYTIDRISKIALAALRVAIYEINYREDIPNNVSINEALEIVGEYDDEKAKKFVNGILGTYVSEIK